MTEDIHYTNLMLALEKLEAKIGNLEQEIKLLGGTTELKITPEEFSRFLEFVEKGAVV